MPLDDTPDWYKDAVIYELHVRSFRDSDGDGVGDFTGLIQKLDHIAGLGATALWILPFYPSPLRDDGYDIADYCQVNPGYGRVADVRKLVREAHKRGLRVITELVCNHTSDQHPWFQRARRARPGSVYRDYYVWSDTDQRYLDARIIFKDFESSNWTWDPVAQAYYWHRFYSHQPDLNYDSPRVQAEIKKVVDYWLAMGIDGLRLDAIPYLYERDGTNCENLPEGHRFLKDLRAHIDARFPHRMLLAEANQWPEDAVTYLGEGEGDECHMAFHFPVMPRLFMALRMEDRYPIVDIMAQTPILPKNAQWAIFLRNHDELTLEMVTDEERDYMYRAYTQDPDARINLGIRRRLSPLLHNNRRRIELMNGLLFSLPGTPVVYYGDEIGMGDNIHLGDRHGVRTPMQWTADRNAGFSSANRQRLYLPVITDPEYHYEAINVEAQESNPQSQLNWMRRLIALRRRHPAFGRGSFEFVYPENRRVLAFIRQLGEARILVVANLSRFAQFANLDLSAFRGLNPVEIFGRTEFPQVGDGPYPLTLGPHSFYWFSLEPARVELNEEGPLPALSLVDSELVGALPKYLRRQRWFGAKSRRVKEVQVVDTVPLANAQLKLLEVRFADHDADIYALPLVPGPDGQAFDALLERDFNGALLDAIGRRRRFRGRHGDVVALPTAHMPHMNAADGELLPRLSLAEQSNNSVIFGERLILKLYRKLEPGINPDLEMSRFLTEAGFRNVAQVYGALLYRSGRDQTATLAMLQAYVPNRGDAWSQVLDELGSGESGAIERYQPYAELLGRRTAEMHLVLASDPDDPAFAPEPSTMLSIRSSYQSVRTLAAQVLQALRRQLPQMEGESQELARRVTSGEDQIQRRLRALLQERVEAARIRCHGDYHLGQALFTGGDFVIVDFEGEPARPLPERRLKRWALKDVAGMLRSFAYAAAASEVDFGQEWAAAASHAFLRGYWTAAGDAPFVPRTAAERELLLEVMLIEKALYELRYELDNRPQWVSISLRGLAALVERS
ncbi:MAG: maltose alpha-D-glucosyltransferase [Candidatus Dormibacter sp.]|uniref:maltose alpha-D-glucosyltransferase n=1 Tax=Candidatus Dormibacter sp. TaxID=2973982 RepID=UPI000DB511DD|nr:MAG: maltose alpha-D-glucosyltransferase [Candidatus Dormibacteraeota bacterium]